MFARRISHFRRFTVPVCRHSSNLSSKYPFKKLRAYPFQLSPEDAILHLAPYASFVCLFKNLVGSIGARFLPGFGFEPLRPVRITPVYFPGWIVDAEVSAEVAYGDVERTTTGLIHDSYVPGCDFRVLSWVSYTSQALDHIEPVPFTEDLEVQYGTEVTCMPYTISPLSALDIAHSTYGGVELAEDLRFAPKSVKTNMISAYPVLFPLYLAQYEFPSPGKPRLVTLFIEAGEPKGRIRAERLDLGSEIREMLPMAPQSFVEFTHEMDAIDVQVLRGEPPSFFSVAGFVTPDKRGIAQAASDWLNTQVLTHGAAPALAEKTGVITSDDDPRIRSLSFDEKMENTKWMLLSGDIASMKRVVEQMKETHAQGRIITIGGGKKAFPEDIFDTTISNLQSKIDELETRRRETTPSWWKEWLELSEKKSD